MSISLVAFEPLENKSERKKFIHLPFEISAKEPGWVPPLKLTVEDALDTKKNPFYKHARIRLWNAYKDGKHVGRIAACVDDKHNEFHGEKTGFWGFLECTNDAEVSGKLIDAAEDWLKKQGMTLSRGPANPSFNHEVGMLLNNFERDPYIMMTHNPAYLPDLVEKKGYKKAKDLLAFEMEATKSFAERVERLAEKIKQRGKITFRPINMKNFAAEVQLIKDIYNDAWEKNWGFVPMDDAEFAHMAKSLKDVIWPEFCLIAFSGDEPIGFSLSLPDLNQLMKDIPNGKLLPYGIFKILFGVKPSAKKMNRVRVITLGVKKKWRTSGVASVFYLETYRIANKMGLWGGEASWILEDNREMLSAIEAFAGVSAYKTYRIYDKALT